MVQTLRNWCTGKNPGERFTMDGKEYYFIKVTPMNDVKVMTTQVFGHAAYDVNNSNLFDPSRVGSIAHTMNTTYYNSLSAKIKQMLVFNSWHNGNETNEAERVVDAYVGLLTMSEFRKAVKLFSPVYKVPELNHAEWTITTAVDYTTANIALNAAKSGLFETIQSNLALALYRPVVVLKGDVSIDENNEVMLNSAPSINVTSPTTNQTLYENSLLTVAGSAADTDIDNVVTIKYQIDSGTVRNLHSAVSDGATAINFSKSLIYKDSMLYDGTTAITSVLDKDVPHTVSMWAEDGNGGKSAIITRTFFVVPNRPPMITIAPITTQSGMINSEVINVSGAVTDLDNNDVTVTFKINGGEEQQVYNGPPSAFIFNILLANLKNGANTVIVKATDTYNMSGTKTLTIHKTHNAVPVNEAVARYQILAPTGSAKSVLLWIERTLGNLGIEAQVSLTDVSEAENYVDLTKTNTGIKGTYHQDEFAYQGAVEKDKIILKITYTRTDAAVTDVIKQISGVLF